MTIEEALKKLNLDATVVAADISSARAAALDANLIVTSPELVGLLGSTQAKVVTTKNFMDVGEMTERLREALSAQT